MSSQSPAEQAMSKLVSQIYAKADAEPFREPVDWQAQGLFDYPQLVKKPMDLGLVKDNLKTGKYKSIHEAAEDVRLIWKNCMTYNPDGSYFYILAENMAKKFEDKFSKLVAEHGEAMGEDLPEKADKEMKKWMLMYEGLKEFQEENGHCEVPSRSDLGGNRSLSHWIDEQRRRFDNDKLSEKQINLLNSIGFIWSVWEFEWNENYQLLKEYKEKNGHCEVPKGYYLSSWVAAQRRHFRHNTLSEERTKLLQAIGFMFRETYGTPSKKKSTCNRSKPKKTRASTLPSNVLIKNVEQMQGTAACVTNTDTTVVDNQDPNKHPNDESNSVAAADASEAIPPEPEMVTFKVEDSDDEAEDSRNKKIADCQETMTQIFEENKRQLEEIKLLRSSVLELNKLRQENKRQADEIKRKDDEIKRLRASNQREKKANNQILKRMQAVVEDAMKDGA